MENDLYSDRALDLLKGIYPSTGRAHVVGITGPPGVGKSTLIGSIVPLLMEEGKKVAVIAIDASSPFSKGSILGNRIRMQESLTKHSVYMRSLSTRGLNGGLSFSALGTVKILDAAGYDTIILETVGAGQSDLDIMRLAGTVTVILAPGLGDEIQAIKAGLMEIAHIFAVNKSDRDGAFQAIKDVQDILMTSMQGDWKIPVVGTSTVTGEGLRELVAQMERHASFVPSVKDRGSVLKNELSLIVESELMKMFYRSMENDREVTDIVEEVSDGSMDPFTGSRRIISAISEKINSSATTLP